MIPGGTALAQTAAAPKLRAGFFYMPHGAIMWNTAHGAEMDRWTPSGAGADFKLSPILEPLESYKHYVTSFGNLENKAPQSSVHAFVPATWLSGVRPDEEADGREHGADDRPDDRRAHRPGHGAAVARGRVRDDGAERRVRQRRLATTAPRCRSATPRRRCRWSSTRARCSRSCSAKATRPRSARRSRRRRAACSTSSPSARPTLQRHARRAATASCSTTTSRPCARSSGASRRRRQRDLSGIDLPEAPIGELTRFDEQVKLMFDLIALAYQANLTRVASYIMVAEGTNRTYNHIGVSGRVPPAVAPREQQGRRIEKLVKIQTLPRGAVRGRSSPSSRRRPTATARCSTTRCSCTART